MGQPERAGGWRLPLPAWRHLVFTRQGHTLEDSLMPAGDGPSPRWRLVLRIRRDAPPVMR